MGGGAFLDMVGFVAATTHRGVRHVRVPTTVLAQNDSGVGVKNGVNTFGVKNFVGAFAPPFAVLNDANFLRTLHPRDRIAGIAEAVKVGLIRDAVFFEWLESQVEALRACAPEAMARMIRRCAELHMRQIAHGGDPFESGSARPLDYGHWSAHKLEALTNHELRHGEAVAIGIALDSRYSVQIGMLAAGEEERIFSRAQRARLLSVASGAGAARRDGRWLVLDGLREFREHLGGELTITLLRAIGRGEEVHVMDEDEILQAIGWLQAARGRAMIVGDGGSPAASPATSPTAPTSIRARPGRRCAATSASTCPRCGHGWRPTGRSASGCACRREAASALAQPEAMREFKDFLARERLYVFTLNGFPYGTFHGKRVKEDVYLPDWRGCEARCTTPTSWPICWRSC